MKIIGQFWRMANIAKMSTSASQSRFPMEFIGKFWKLTNIDKMGMSANQSH